jgi:hypothetical protein
LNIASASAALKAHEVSANDKIAAAAIADRNLLVLVEVDTTVFPETLKFIPVLLVEVQASLKPWQLLPMRDFPAARLKVSLPSIF